MAGWGYIIYRKEGPLSILHLIQFNFIKMGGQGNKVKNLNLDKKFHPTAGKKVKNYNNKIITIWKSVN